MKKYLFLLFLLSFVTSSSAHAQTSSFTFGAAGDFANGSNYANLTASVRQQNPDLFLAVGDLAYTTAEQNWCGKWGTFTNLLLLTGNHDSGESSSGNIQTYIQYCPQAPVNITGTYGHNYYFDYPVANPLVRFIMVRPGMNGSYGPGVINYGVGGAGYTFTSDAIDDARAKGIKWIVVGMHKNFISAMEKGNEVGTPYMNLLFSKKVDLVLQGHEHGYERTKQLSCATAGTYVASCVAATGGNFLKGNGLVIDVVGTGGQSFRALNTADSEYPYFQIANNTSSNYGWGKFNVSASQISYNYVNVGGGGMVDSFSITDNPNATPSPISTSTPIPTATIRPTNTPTTRPTSTPIPSATPTTIPGQPSSTPLPTNTPTKIPTPTSISCFSLPNTYGTVTGSVSVDVTGQYAVWSRIMSESDATNSFYLQIDNECPVVVGDFNSMAKNSWVWVDYMNGNPTSRILMSLTSGVHAIKITGREAGLKLDSLVFASNLQCIPVNNGSNCTSPVVTATLVPTMIPSNTPVIPTSTILPTQTPVPTPTPTLPVGTSSVVYPIEDTYVTSVHPGAAHGLVTELFVDGNPTKVTYMKFDLQSLAGKNISSAVLRVKVTASKDAPSVSPQRVRMVADNLWSESLMTYENRPTLSSVVATNSKGGKANQWIDFDITSYAKANRGKIFSLAIDSLRADGMNISSSEAVANNRPRLEIKY